MRYSRIYRTRDSQRRAILEVSGHVGLGLCALHSALRFPTLLWWVHSSAHRESGKRPIYFPLALVGRYFETCARSRLPSLNSGSGKAVYHRAVPRPSLDSKGQRANVRRPWRTTVGNSSSCSPERMAWPALRFQCCPIPRNPRGWHPKSWLPLTWRH